MYLNPSPPAVAGDRAILYSGAYEPTLTGDCVKFWYYMGGAGAGSLSIWRSMDGNLDGPLWTKSGDQGALWRYGYVTISANAEFMVGFTCYYTNTYTRPILIRLKIPFSSNLLLEIRVPNYFC